jgi:hypothetical protein
MANQFRNLFTFICPSEFFSFAMELMKIEFDTYYPNFLPLDQPGGFPFDFCLHCI